MSTGSILDLACGTEQHQRAAGLPGVHAAPYEGEATVRRLQHDLGVGRPRDVLECIGGPGHRPTGEPHRAHHPGLGHQAREDVAPTRAGAGDGRGERRRAATARRGRRRRRRCGSRGRRARDRGRRRRAGAAGATRGERERRQEQQRRPKPHACNACHACHVASGGHYPPAPSGAQQLAERGAWQPAARAAALRLPRARGAARCAARDVSY